jgi:hypothetical protein
MGKTRAGWLGIGYLLLSACGASEPTSPAETSPTETSPTETSPTETSPAEPPHEAASDAEGAADEADDERARMIREAEAFVRAQGYTDTPATVSGDDVVHEFIEGTLEDRRGTLEPHAVRASGANGDWGVIFAYREARYAGRGRMLRIRAGQTPSFVHQDLLLSPPTDEGAAE